MLEIILLLMSIFSIQEPVHTDNFYVELSKDGRAICSGFLIDKNTAISSLHCNKSANKVLHDGIEYKYSVIKTSAKLDIMILELQENIVLDNYAEFAKDGTYKAYFYGSCRMRKNQVRIVFNITSDTSNVLDNIACQGDSGSPILDEHGKVVGVVSRIYPIGYDDNLGVYYGYYVTFTKAIDVLNLIESK